MTLALLMMAAAMGAETAPAPRRRRPLPSSPQDMANFLGEPLLGWDDHADDVRIYHPRALLPLPEDVAGVGDRLERRGICSHPDYDPARMARADAKRARKAAKRRGEG